MQRFTDVRQALRHWYESFGWYSLVRPYEIHAMFGGLAVLLLKAILYELLSYKSYHGLDVLFYTIPLASLAYVVFLLGAWLSLASSNVSYVPYALWAYALICLFPFTHMSLSSLIVPVVYAVLGYAVFRYTVSASVAK